MPQTPGRAEVAFGSGARWAAVKDWDFTAQLGVEMPLIALDRAVRSAAGGAERVCGGNGDGWSCATRLGRATRWEWRRSGRALPGGAFPRALTLRIDRFVPAFAAGPFR